MARKTGKNGLRKNAHAKGLGNKEAQFLHVREFSQGKPNEFSLNVLEQKAAAQEGSQKKRTHFWQRFGSSAGASSKASSPSEISLSSLESSSDAASRETASVEPFLQADSRAEIARRQKRRRWYRRMSIAAVIVLCLVGAGFGVRYAYDQYEHWNTNVGALKEACSLIEESDEVTVAIDEYFQESLGENTVETVADLVDQLPDAREKLDAARLFASRASDELEGSQRDKEAAEAALNAISARETLFEVAEERLNDDSSAQQAIDAMNEAWQAIQEGNSLMNKAAQVISDTTNDNVNTSTEYTTAAQEQFNEALDSVEQAEKLYSDADLDDVISYINKRLEAAEEALASNEAILIQDKATAESHNEAYNKADSEAATMAESFPDTFSQPIIDAYISRSESLIERYDAARSDAAANDSLLREYLGVATNN